MAIGDVVRLTSKNLHIEFKPALVPYVEAGSYASYETDMNHVCVLDLGGAASGTFKLQVNGHTTAAITAAADLASTAVEAALEALPNVGTGNLEVTGSAGGAFTITAAGDLENQFLIIEVVQATGAATAVTLTVTSQGSTWYRLDAEVSNFSYSGTMETTDVSGISDEARREASTISDATWEMMLYETLSDYRQFLTEGVEGYIRVFEDGKAVGKRYFAWEVMLKDVGSDFQAFEKIEISVSGRRQGAPIARVGSIWA